MLGSSKLNELEVNETCEVCHERDIEPITNWVSCDICEKWFHYKCVGVDESVREVDWACSSCCAQQQQEKEVEKLRRRLKELTGNICVKDSTATDKRNDCNPGNVSTGFNDGNSETCNHKNVSNIKDSSTYERASCKKIRKTDSDHKSLCTSVSRTSSRRKKDIKLEFLEEELKLRLEFLKRKEKIEEEFSDLNEDSDNDTSWQAQSHNRTESWVTAHLIPKKSNAVPSREKERVPMYVNQGKIEKEIQNDVFGNMKSIEKDERNVSMKQIAMRQIISRDQHGFSGSTEQWPMFQSWFENSTKECGYNESENLARLRQLLTGQALSLVKRFLFYPGTLNEIWSVLQNKYGRPDQILQMLHDEIQKHGYVSEECLESILEFSVTVQHVIATMKASGLNDFLNNPTFVQQLVDNLSGPLVIDWANYKANHPKSDLTTFGDWIGGFAKNLSSVASVKRSKREEQLTKRPENKKQHNFTHSMTEADHARDSRCLVCNEEIHKLSECQLFLEMTKIKRWDFVRQNNDNRQNLPICRKCLGFHSAMRCRRFDSCGVDGCQYKHHPLLHNEVLHSKSTDTTRKFQSKQESEIKLATPICDATAAETVSHHLTSTRILLRILPVILYGPKLRYETFALFDEGSTVSLIDEEVAQILELSGPVTPLYLNWTGDVHREEENSRLVNLKISGVSSATNQYKQYEMSDIRTVTSLNLPEQTLRYDSTTSKLEHLKGLPVVSYTNARPRIIIGANHFDLSLPLRTRQGKPGEPIATKTKLGWAIVGPHPSNEIRSEAIEHHFHICGCNADENLHEEIQNFFSLENFGVSKPGCLLISDEDKRANDILQNTTVKVGDRYESGLLWRYDDVQFPNSYKMARRRLFCLESRMAKDLVLAENLRNQMKSYVEKEYARKLSSNEIAQVTHRTWYLPVFVHLNPNKPGKVRMIWDAAATVDGISLNSMLLKGPDLLNSLTDILHRFRERKIALTGDIREMYHQVLIKSEDQQAQRFLWRDDSTKEIDVYVMRVMTFGAACSPCTAHYVKNSNAVKFLNTHPRASLAISENHYVDDWLDSFSTEEEAISVAKDVIKIHAAAGFEIRNFTSNSSKFLSEVGSSASSHQVDLNLDSNSDNTKVLGMWWSCAEDSFYYTMNLIRIAPEILNGQRNPTKREVLKTVMMIFDPLGLIACYLVYAKILLQDIWRSKIGWDQQISYDLNKKWTAWTKNFSKLREIKIPRCYFGEKYDKLEMHIFVDASKDAYAAVVYFRYVIAKRVRCVLVTAKTKVAPLRPPTIPRLELLAAVLGSRLGNSVVASHTIQPTERVFWSDSIDVLSWLRSDTRKYKEFVAYRVNEILDTTKLSEWRWVPTEDNVADEGTKWKNQPKLDSNSRWFNAPKFLYLPKSEWPIEPSREINTIEEVLSLHTNETIKSMAIPTYERFSNWNRLRRTQAWVIRVIHKVYRFYLRLQSKGQLKASEPCELSPEEVLRAEEEIFRDVQHERFAGEIAHLKNSPDKSLKRSSQIFKMTPFLDKQGVLRIRGRVREQGGVLYDTINPIILPRNHHVTDLIIEHYHRKYLHENNELVLNEIKQRFAIPRVRRCLQKVRSNCQFCKNERAKPQPPRMASHPLARQAIYSAPFSYVGLDYFGPIETVVGRRVEKRWIALFTCLTIRAVHLEIVHSLNKNSCWMAIRNFISIRGVPIEIRSDRGTNFIGVASELRALYNSLSIDDYRREFGEIRWIFNPPLSPHMGGCWERLVRSIKRALLRSMPTKKPNDESLRCYLMEAANMVNSRPLTHVALDNIDQEALTPNHFLKGSSSGAKPLFEFSESENLSGNHEFSQQMANVFWKRWIKEYIPELTRTSKWYGPVKPIEIGDIVIIMDDDRRDSWRKGRVIDVLKRQNDQQVRQIIVKTANNKIYTRATAKVAVLDLKRKPSSGTERQFTEGEYVANIEST